jgi:hypothetical protein
MGLQNYKGYEAINQTSGRKFIGLSFDVITDKNRSKRPGILCGKIDPKDGPAMASGVLSVLYAVWAIERRPMTIS